MTIIYKMLTGIKYVLMISIFFQYAVYYQTAKTDELMDG